MSQFPFQWGDDPQLVKSRMRGVRNAARVKNVAPCDYCGGTDKDPGVIWDVALQGYVKCTMH